MRWVLEAGVFSTGDALAAAAARAGHAVTAWDEAWGGELELWDRARTRCEVRISPVRDRLVVMAHGEDTWHGHPQPLACPEGRMRAVVAAYFYAARAAPGDDDHAHGAVWA